jgi:thioredoxin-dependent peroxiredoxin
MPIVVSGTTSGELVLGSARLPIKRVEPVADQGDWGGRVGGGPKLAKLKTMTWPGSWGADLTAPLLRSRLPSVAKGPRPGDPAPDFELDGTGGHFHLSSHRGERVILLFYPGDETPVCTRQFCSYRDRAEDMAELDAVVVGISAQSVASHETFRDHHDLTVQLLADEDRAVAKAYGVSAPAIGTRRAVFVIDEDGIVRHRHVHALGLDYQGVDELREALASLGTRA